MSFQDGIVPDSDIVSLYLLDDDVTIDNWENYDVTTHFLAATSHWHMSVSDDRIGPKLGARLTPGKICQLRCNYQVIATGRIDLVQVQHNRDSGTNWTITGRDLMGQAVDSCINPWKHNFNPTQSLHHIASEVFADYGFHTFVEDNSANRAFAVGQTHGTRFSKARPGKHHRKAPVIRPLKTYQLNEQVKPHDHEGAYQFVERLAKRFGLHIWLSVDGQSVIIGKPDFDQPPQYMLQHAVNAQNVAIDNNVVGASVTVDATDQPSYIVASGSGAGGLNYHGNLRVVVFNELVCFSADGVGAANFDPTDIEKKHLGAQIIPPRTGIFPPSAFIPLPVSRPVYLHDEESHTLEQLTNFARRELAHRQRRALTANYEVEGHTSRGAVWTRDTIVSVDDDTTGITENLYVVGTNLSKSRSRGTRTRLELIRPHTMAF